MVKSCENCIFLMRKYWRSFYLLVKRNYVLCVPVFCGAVCPVCRVVECSVVAGFVHCVRAGSFPVTGLSKTPPAGYTPVYFMRSLK
jgi:hypothetical protein